MPSFPESGRITERGPRAKVPGRASTLVDLGDAGHIDTASGFGPWPDGERLVGALG